MQSNDQELISLIARCAIKDQAAFETLYRRLSAYLNMVAFRIVKSEEISNEVLQEAFIQIWQNADTYRPHLSKPLTWLTSIVRYRALDRLELEKKNAVHLSDVEELDDLPDSSDEKGPYALIESGQTFGHIKECLQALNEKISKCMELAYFHGYSREELASSMGANINTVKSWLHRGSERLKKCLETKMTMTS